MLKRLLFSFFFFLCFAMVASLRVDDKPGFRLCDEPQLARLESVEVSSCWRWPCVLIAGRTGYFRVWFTHNARRALKILRSDINSYFTLERMGPMNGNHKVSLPGESQVSACDFVTTGCPVPPGRQVLFTKELTVPQQVRIVSSMLVELKVTAGSGETVFCFMAPVLV